MVIRSLPTGIVSILLIPESDIKPLFSIIVSIYYIKIRPGVPPQSEIMQKEYGRRGLILTFRPGGHSPPEFDLPYMAKYKFPAVVITRSIHCKIKKRTAALEIPWQQLRNILF
jgi:hypothetical protein